MGMRKRVSPLLVAVMLLLLMGILTIIVSTGSVAPAAAAPAVCEPALKVMPVGDSITVGVDSTTDAGYRLPLFNLLDNAGYAFKFVGRQPTIDNDSCSEFNHPNGFIPCHEGYSGFPTGNVVFRNPNIMNQNNPDVVLLHLGTNDFTNIKAATDQTTIDGLIADAVANMGLILDNIDDYETDNSKTVTVFVARIINQACDEANTACVKQRQAVTDYNIALQAMIDARHDDDIIVVDMETGANLIYELQPAGDFFDDPLHPGDTGYEKMADAWFAALQDSGILTCGVPNIVSKPVSLAGVAQPYQYQVNAVNDAGATYTLTTSPTGMQIDTGGLITWTPTSSQIGKHDVVVQVQNGNGTDSQQFEVEVKILLYLPLVNNQ